MDLTAPKIAEVERFDLPEVVDRLATELANQIKTGKHFIAFTGAGASTSAGIPDFRGPEGAWTLRAQGRQLNFKSITTLQAIPTPTHMALVELQNRGLLKYLISQNCDGLHRRSGILPVSLKLVTVNGRSILIFIDKLRTGYLNFMAIATASTARTAERSSFAVCACFLVDSEPFSDSYQISEPSRPMKSQSKTIAQAASARVAERLCTTPSSTLAKTFPSAPSTLLTTTPKRPISVLCLDHRLL